MRTDFTRGFAIAVAVIALWISGPALAASARLIVNGDVITDHDIDSRARLMAMIENRLDHRQFLDKARSELIDETLILQAAERNAISIERSIAREEFLRLAGENGFDGGDFEAIIRQEGVDPEELVDRIQANFLWQQFSRVAVRNTSQIREQDVVASLDREAVQNANTTRLYTIVPILFALPETPTQDVITSQIARARETSRLVDGCEDLSAVRRLPDAVVKPQVLRRETDMPRPLVEVLRVTPVGAVTEPVYVGNAVEALVVCDSKDIQSQADLFASTREALLGGGAREKLRSLLYDLRRRAIIEEL